MAQRVYGQRRHSLALVQSAFRKRTIIEVADANIILIYQSTKCLFYYLSSFLSTH